MPVRTIKLVHADWQQGRDNWLHCLNFPDVVEEGLETTFETLGC